MGLFRAKSENGKPNDKLPPFFVVWFLTKTYFKPFL